MHSIVDTANIISFRAFPHTIGRKEKMPNVELMPEIKCKHIKGTANRTLASMRFGATPALHVRPVSL